MWHLHSEHENVRLTVWLGGFHVSGHGEAFHKLGGCSWGRGGPALWDQDEQGPGRGAGRRERQYRCCRGRAQVFLVGCVPVGGQGEAAKGLMEVGGPPVGAVGDPRRAAESPFSSSLSFFKKSLNYIFLLTKAGYTHRIKVKQHNSIVQEVGSFLRSRSQM